MKIYPQYEEEVNEKSNYFMFQHFHIFMNTYQSKDLKEVSYIHHGCILNTVKK